MIINFDPTLKLKNVYDEKVDFNDFSLFLCVQLVVEICAGKVKALFIGKMEEIGNFGGIQILDQIKIFRQIVNENWIKSKLKR